MDNPDSSDVAIDQESLAENLVREGLEYVIGRNVFQDYLTAEKKFKAAARLGSIDAKNELIDLYRMKTVYITLKRRLSYL